jgi:hypothetical protein
MIAALICIHTDEELPVSPIWRWQKKGRVFIYLIFIILDYS